MDPIVVSAVIVAASIPLIFLYFVHWLDLYSSERPKLILLSLGWGAFSVWLAYQINHPMLPIYGQQVVAGMTGPVIEEFFKSLVLIYLVRRSAFTYSVDGAIYGFAVGTGFGVAENMLYLTKVDPSMTIVLAVSRVFSSALLHGTASGMVGIALGRFRFGRGRNRIGALLLGWAAAMATHLTYNNVALQPWGTTGYLILVGIGLSGVVLVAGFVLWGLRDEGRWLRDTLDEKLGISKAEANLVQHSGELEDLLAPVAKHFGQKKRDQVAKFLQLEAQLGIKREVEKKTIDPKTRAALDAEITSMEQKLNAARRDVGMYVMSYVRSISNQTPVPVRVAAPLPTKPSLWSDIGGRIENQTNGESNEDASAN